MNPCETRDGFFGVVTETVVRGNCSVTASRKVVLCGNEVPVCTSLLAFHADRVYCLDINTELMMCIGNC